MADRIRTPLSEASRARRRLNSRTWYAAVCELISRHRPEFLRILNDKKAATDEQHQ
jgi:hypothetical protein